MGEKNTKIKRHINVILGWIIYTYLLFSYLKINLLLHINNNKYFIKSSLLMFECC